MEIDHNTQLYGLTADKSLKAIEFNNYPTPRKDCVPVLYSKKIRQLEAQALK